jgi:hypothetical protein
MITSLVHSRSRVRLGGAGLSVIGFSNSKTLCVAGSGSREFLIRRLGGVENSAGRKSTMVMLEPGLTNSTERVQLLWNHCSN